MVPAFSLFALEWIVVIGSLYSIHSMANGDNVRKGLPQMEVLMAMMVVLAHVLYISEQ
jgi:hypothetical protein